jgi:peptide deformylase
MKPKPAPLAIVAPEVIPVAGDTPTTNLLDVFRVITQMERICSDSKGIGLSAVQVGVPWKLFIVLRGDRYEYYLNCEYTGVGDAKGKSIEGCLSLRDTEGRLRRFEVERFPVVTVKGKRLILDDEAPALKLEDVNSVERGLYAVVFQHEIDHQNNVLISDIGKELEIQG